MLEGRDEPESLEQHLRSGHHDLGSGERGSLSVSPVNKTSEGRDVRLEHDTSLLDEQRTI